MHYINVSQLQGRHPSCHPNLEKNVSLVGPTRDLQLCDGWIFSNFVIMKKLFVLDLHYGLGFHTQVVDHKQC